MSVQNTRQFVEAEIVLTPTEVTAASVNVRVDSPEMNVVIVEVQLEESLKRQHL